MRLKGRAAIVAGGLSGIGRASVELFAAEGADVLTVDRPAADLAAAHAGRERVSTFKQGVTTNDAPESIVETVVERSGRLDILFNKAGDSRRVLVGMQTGEEWDLTLSVNLAAQFRPAMEAVPHLKEPPAGRIINTPSLIVRMTDYGLVAYSVSRAGVGGLTRMLALDLGKFGITANYIEPRVIQTGTTKAALRRLGELIDSALPRIRRRRLRLAMV